MADTYEYDPHLDPMNEASSVRQESEVTWGDRGKALAQGALETGSQVAALARGTSDATDSPNASAISDYFYSALKLGGERVNESMSDAAREQMSASVMSPEFWEHPVSASFLKTLQMTPGVAASVVPAFLFPAGVAATMGVAAAGGALGAGMSLDDIYRQTDAITDEEATDPNNKKFWKYYAGLRSMGMSEDEARADANKELMGLKPLLNAAMNAGAMVLGPAGRVAGMIPEAAGAGLGKRMAAGAGEGALGGAGIGATLEATHQQTEIDLDQRTQMDPSLIAAAAGEMAIITGAMGGAAGIVTGKPSATKARPDAPVATVDSLGPDAAQTVALSDAPPVVAQEAAPVGSEPVPAAPAADGMVTTRLTPEGDALPAEAPVTDEGNIQPPTTEPVVPEGPNIAALAEDAGKTVPEAPATLQAQQEQLVGGQRRAMLFPKGGEAPLPLPPGMKAALTKDGTFHYDPKLMKRADIYAASKEGRLNEILDLGNYSKADLAPRVAAGEPMLAVLERAPNGTEVKAAAGTTGTAPDQLASLEATKTPGNIVTVENPADVIQARAAAARDAAAGLRQAEVPGAPREPRVLRQEPVAPAPVKPAKVVKVAPEPVIEAEAPRPVVSEELPAQKMAEINHTLESLWQRMEELESRGTPIKGGIEAMIERRRAELVFQAKKQMREAGEGEPAPAAPRARAAAKNEGKKWTKAEKTNAAAAKVKSAAIAERFQPGDVEHAYFIAKGEAKAPAREAVVARVRGMVEAARKEGVRVREKLMDSKDKDMEPSHNEILLAEAAAIEKASHGKNGVSDEMLTSFLTREYRLRTGHADDRAAVLSERRVEGEAKMSVKSTENIENRPEPAVKIEEIIDETGESRDTPDVDDGEVRQAAVEPKERAKVALKGDEVVQGKDSTGTFKTEVKQRARRQVNKDGSVSDGDMSPEAAASMLRLEKALEGKNIHEVTDHLIANSRMADRAIARRVAKVLRKMEANGVKFEFKIAHLGDTVPRALFNARALAVWNFADRQSTIWINGSDVRGKEGMTPQTILHELVHTATQQALYAGRHSKADFVTKQLHRELVDLGDAVIKHFNAKARQYQNGDMGALNKFEKEIFDARNNALRNEDEILAWGMTNPHMQDMMEAIPYRKGTAWTGFVESVRRFLGMNPREHTALSELLRIADNLFEVDDISVASQLSGYFGQVGLQTNYAVNAHQLGDFVQPNELFRGATESALSRAREGASDLIDNVTSPGKIMTNAIGFAKDTGGVASRALRKFTTNMQFVGRRDVSRLLPMARKLADDVERIGVVANKLKEEGMELGGAILRAQKAHPAAFENFSRLIHDQTMLGADASTPLGAGRNRHLALSKELQAKVDAGTPLNKVASQAAMTAWEGRNAHADLQRRYAEIIRENPEFAQLQKQVFDYYEIRQTQIARDQIDSILRTYNFKGTDAERAAAAAQLHAGKISPEMRADLETKINPDALDLIDKTTALKVVNGPYAPLMRRGDHAVIGEYKVAEPANGAKIDDSTWEFKSREEAHKFAAKTGLHTTNRSVWYDTATGKRVKAKDDAISTVGAPEQRWQVEVQRQHLEFLEDASDARVRVAELQESGLLDRVGLEERRVIESEDSQFSGRGVETLLRSLANQDAYKAATEHERVAMRQTIREAGLRAMSDNRVQARRLPRRFVKGASDDIARNLFEYNNSQANYRARMQFRGEIDTGLKAMWDHVKAERYTPDNEARSSAANEMERRVRAPDPNDYTGAYTEWSRRLLTWSYIDRMMRPSYLILDQMHMPMITTPYMAGRHGVMTAYGQTLKAWKEVSGFYGAGGHDAWAATVGSSLQKGSDFAALGKKAVSKSADGVRLGQMMDALSETGLINPAAGVEVGKYMPDRQLGGVLGSFDKGMQKADTIFRHLKNSTEAVNRIASSVAAYRMEFSKLTRAGKNEADAHTASVEYARTVLLDTQGLYSSTNAAPIFKNKFLKPFLQFKQFPQMMYHLLGKLATQSLKGETREVRVQAMASLAAIITAHAAMVGAMQGTPLEPFKVLGLISKGIGLTEGDWSDVDMAVRKAVKANLGEDVGTMVLDGAGSGVFGVDVHNRLGLHSLLTSSTPDKLDSKSVSEYALNMAMGAPGALVTDAIKGTNKMVSGDFKEGALQAFPLQLFRDWRQAIDPKATGSGFEPTTGERFAAGIGFTPARKAAMNRQRTAVFNETRDYNDQRSALTKQWVDAEPADRETVWEKIRDWNAAQPAEGRLTKGDLFKSAHRKRKSIANNTVAGVRVNAHNKSIAQAAMDLF